MNLEPHPDPSRADLRVVDEDCPPAPLSLTIGPSDLWGWEVELMEPPLIDLGYRWRPTKRWAAAAGRRLKRRVERRRLRRAERQARREELPT